MNDPVAERLFRIENAMRYTALTRAEATAKVDAEIATEEAAAKAYFYLLQSVRRIKSAAA